MALGSEDKFDRYLRQILVKEIGGQGQETLSNSKVLVLGAGGLGAPLLLYLSAAGVGHLGVIDHDNVDLSNLQRQILYKTSDVGKPKIEAAELAIKRLNPNVTVSKYNMRLSDGFDNSFFKSYDIVVDGSDTLNTKNLIARNCIKLSKALLTGSVSKWEGQIFLYDPSVDSSCYSCVYGDLLDYEQNDCNHIGIVGTVAGIVGSMMASETIKYLIGTHFSLKSNLLIYDGLLHNLKKIVVQKNHKCNSCCAN